MFYPPNFPSEKENLLLEILSLLQGKTKNQAFSQKKFQKQFYQILSLPQFQKEFSGKTPPFWWFNFLLLRHQKLFSQSFINLAQKFFLKTATRSLSGIIPVAVFTQPKGCPFNCIYCPQENNLPKSYFSDEPAVMRAQRNNFDPYWQTKNRLIGLLLSGHPIDKLEIIIKGGTFSFYPQNYRRQFVKKIFDAANEDILKLIQSGKEKRVPSSSLKEAQEKNQKSPSRIIGIIVETRPDFINPEEILFLRELGVTHVEIGVEAPDDQILKLINRGHDTQAIKKATFLLKEAGFKINYHLMPNLPGSSPQKDLKLLKKIPTPDFSPDHLKIYPTVVTKFTQLEKWYQTKKYQPYSLEELIDVLVQFKSQIVPRWVRISRLARDISLQMISGPILPSNLRQIVQKKLKEKNLACPCLRCREIKNQKPSSKPILKIASYDASQGKEYFLEYTDSQNHCLGFLRLRIPTSLLDPTQKPIFPFLRKAALVRELHVYGPVASLRKKSPTTQHQGIGKKLLQKAEEIARENHAQKIAVISGVGVRPYYRRFGYRLCQTYMVKSLPNLS